MTPYTPATRLADGKRDAAFHTKPQIALGLIEQAIAAGIHFQAIVSDCFYGENNAFGTILLQRRLPYVLARRGNTPFGWAAREVAHTFREAASEAPASAWHKVERTFRNGHLECWWACELRLFRYGPDRPVRAICATTDRDALPDIATWYLTTNLSTQQAPLAHIVRLYGLRNWIEQGYKQMKNELGWADFIGTQRPCHPAPLDAGTVRIDVLLVARQRAPDSAQRHRIKTIGLATAGAKKTGLVQ